MIGAIIAIIASRLYVFLNGNLNIYFDGVLMHHFYYGVAILALVIAILIFTDILHLKDTYGIMSLLLGLALGFMTDELNILFYPSYNLTDYYQPINFIADFMLIMALLFLTINQKQNGFKALRLK